VGQIQCVEALSGHRLLQRFRFLPPDVRLQFVTVIGHRDIVLLLEGIMRLDVVESAASNLRLFHFHLHLRPLNVLHGHCRRHFLCSGQVLLRCLDHDRFGAGSVKLRCWSLARGRCVHGMLQRRQSRGGAVVVLSGHAAVLFPFRALCV